MLLAAPEPEAARMNMYACADWCLPWKRVFRLGLLLQSGAPFDRSSESWSIPLRTVGPDRFGTVATADPAASRSSMVGVWHILALHYG